MKERTKELKAVFISVPMHEKDEASIERSIQLAKRAYCRRKKISAKDVWFYDNLSYVNDFENQFNRNIVSDDNPHPRIMYLATALCGLSYCDEAVFGKGWKEANGCCIEHEVCERYGIPIIDLEQCVKYKVDKKTKEITRIK